MNTKIIVGAVVAVAVVAGLWYYLSGMGANTTTPSDQAGAVASQDEATSGTGTLESLIARGGNYQCTVTISNEGTQSSGVVYISGNKLSGDFTAVAQGVTVKAYMISDGEYVYSWSDMVAQGFKMPVEVSSSASAGAAQTGIDMAAGVSYDCDPWTPDASKFVPPTTIEFSTLGK